MANKGLDTSSSYTFKALEQKYGAFLAPDFVIHVGSIKLDSHKVPVTGLEVKMGLEGAGYARFTLQSLYDYKLSKWVSDLISKIEVGQLVDVEVGYAGSDRRIFLGYVDSYTISFDSGSSPGLSITAMDAMAILNADRREISFGNLKDDEAIQKLIKDCKISELVEKVSFDPIQSQEKNDVKKNVSRGAFIAEQAKKCFFSFCIINGELIFKNLMKNTKVLTTLTMGLDLKSYQRTVNLKSRMVGKVTVKSTGDTVSKEPVQSSTTAIPGSSGTDATKVKYLKEAELVVDMGELRTVEECKAYSENILRSISWGFMEADAECIGYPEMTPGRFIRLEGLDKRSNGDYFVTSVIHSFSSEGYVNKIHMKGFNEKKGG